MKLQLYQVDAFTSKLFQGNPAAVCPLQEWLPDNLMQSMAAENNLAETAFYVSQGSDFHLRWFTPTVEVDLCGHATLATAHVLFNVYQYPADTLTFHTRSGALTVRKADNRLVMNFPADELTETVLPDAVLEGLQVRPVAAYKGKTDFLVVLDNQQQVENLQPDFRLLATQTQVRGIIVTAPGVDAPGVDTSNTEIDFVLRCFFPQSGVDEDPVTGSAHTTLVPYWAQRLGKKQLTAKQLSRRTGMLYTTYLQNRVEIAGEAVTYMSGMVEL